MKAFNYQYTYRQKLLENKIYRKRDKKKQGSKIIYNYKKIIFGHQRFYTHLLTFLNKNGFIKKDASTKIVYVPENFSFKEQFDDCIRFFRVLLSSLFHYNGCVLISFENCKTASIAPISILRIIVNNYNTFVDSYNENRHNKCKKSIKIISSKIGKRTNHFLAGFYGIELPKEMIDDGQFLPMNMIVGRKRNYKNNTKGNASSTVVSFINNSLKGANLSLTNRAHKAFDNLIGEVLSNSEDHSTPKSDWFVNGISFREKEQGTDVVELNLSIVNFGFSMFEGFEKTKNQNKTVYDNLEKQYLEHRLLFEKNNFFEKESLFTMYMLNPGVSRLKYEEPSRGNGTMKFLNAFITLGTIGNIDPRYNSQLNIISGHTRLTCDNKVKPYNDNGKDTLSLNENMDTKKLPNKNYLEYNKESFPGTVLECTIFFRKDLIEIIKESNHE